MIYQFECESCETVRSVDSAPFHPPQRVVCSCGKPMQRIYGCLIDTSACKDHNDIPEQHRVQRSSRPRNPEKEEARFHKHIQERRSILRDGGGNRGPVRHTHSVPADLYWGKIRQTGDKNYWQDHKNLDRHRETRIEE